MPLDKAKFVYQSHYVGWWCRPDFPNENLSGTLFIEEQNIWIELIFKSNNNEFPEYIKSLKGTTCATDSSDKELSANIIVEDLHFIRYCHLENGLCHYKFSVSEIYIYEGTIDKGNITTIGFRASIIDNWASDLLENNFKTIPYQRLPYNHYLIYYVLPKPYNLLRSPDYNVSLDFTSEFKIGCINQGIEQKSFCNIFFKHHISFQDALEVVEKVKYLFYILTNRIFNIDYLYSESSTNKFFYKPNDKSINRYIEKHSSLDPFTFLSDFVETEIHDIFLKWIDLYSTFSSGLNTYFETITNIYTSSSTKIRNYISTIDMLSKDLKGESGFVDNNTKRAKFINKLISQYNISNDDANQLKTRFLNVTGKELKSRIAVFLSKIEKYKPIDLADDFVEKIVNTRHNITHPKANEQPSFIKDEYNTAARHLQMLIHIYLLNLLGVNENIINKLIACPGLDSTIS